VIDGHEDHRDAARDVDRVDATGRLHRADNRTFMIGAPENF